MNSNRKNTRKLIARMTDAVHAFVAGAEQSDDLTMMAIQFLKGKK